MLYKMNVLIAEDRPNCWDSMENVTTMSCQTPDIKALGEKASPEVMLSAHATRWAVGTFPQVGPRVNIFVNDLGLVFAAPVGGELEDDVLLSRRTWTQVAGLWLRVEPAYEPAATWNARTISKLSLWRRLINKLLKRTCGRCLYFDVDGASQWRHMVTHPFGGVSGKEGGGDASMNACMNDDITKISAADYRLPDFRQGELGYCPRRDCGLAAVLEACGEFKPGR